MHPHAAQTALPADLDEFATVAESVADIVFDRLRSSLTILGRWKQVNKMKEVSGLVGTLVLR